MARLGPNSERLHPNSEDLADLLAVVLHGVTDGVTVQRADGQLVYANAAAARIVGSSSAGELVARDPATIVQHFELLDARGGALPIDALPGRRVLRGEKASELLVRFRVRSTGDERWALVSATLVENPSGGGPLAVNVFRDVTDQQRERAAAERARSALRVRLRQQAAVAELGRLAAAGTDQQMLMQQTATVVAETLGVEFVKILERESDGQSLLLRAGVGWAAGHVGNTRVPGRLDSQAGYTLLRGAPVVVEDLASDDRFHGPALLSEHGVTSGLSVVIPGRARPFGVIGAHTREHRAFTSHDADFLQSVATVLGMAIERQMAEDERFRRLAEHAPDVLYRYELLPVRRVAYVNTAVAELTGYTPEELYSDSQLGQRIVHPEDLPLFQRMQAGEQMPPVITMRWTHKDGRTVWTEIRSVPMYDADGRLAGYEGVARNVTDRQVAEASLERLRRQTELLLASAGEGIYGVDLDGRTIFANAAAARMTGYTADELLGRPLHALVHHSRADGAPYPQAECAIHGAIRNRTVHKRDDEVFWRRDGTCFPVEYTSTPIPTDGEVEGAVVTFRDVTERREAESRLAEQARELARLEERDRIAMDLHDGVIQSLLAVTMGLRARALPLADANTDAAVRPAIDQIQGIVQEIRDYISMLQPRKHGRWGLRVGLEVLAEELRASGLIQVDVELPESAALEGLLEAEGVTHLLAVAREATSNAIRHAAARVVTIRLQRSGDMLTLTIRDDGRGFDAAHVTGRTGRGLGNMRQRALALGGQLAIDSARGHGTLVRLEVALKERKPV